MEVRGSGFVICRQSSSSSCGDHDCNSEPHHTHPQCTFLTSRPVHRLEFSTLPVFSVVDPSIAHKAKTFHPRQTADAEPDERSASTPPRLCTSTFRSLAPYQEPTSGTFPRYGYSWRASPNIPSIPYKASRSTYSTNMSQHQRVTTKTGESKVLLMPIV